MSGRTDDDAPDLSFGRIVRGLLLVSCLGGAIISLAAALSPTREEAVARKAASDLDRKMTSLIANCVATEGPWRCFVSLEEADRANPIQGRTRLERLAGMVSAWEVLSFCIEPRKVDCADRMIGKGFSRQEILESIGE